MMLYDPDSITLHPKDSSACMQGNIPANYSVGSLQDPPRNDHPEVLRVPAGVVQSASLYPN